MLPGVTESQMLQRNTKLQVRAEDLKQIERHVFQTVFLLDLRNTKEDKNIR